MLGIQCLKSKSLKIQAKLTALRREPISSKNNPSFHESITKLYVVTFFVTGGKYQKTIRSKPFFKLNHFQQHSKQKR